MTNILKASVRGTDLIPLEDMLLEESEVFLVDEITQIRRYSRDNQRLRTWQTSTQSCSSD